MGNRLKQVYGLTALSPIEGGRTDGVANAAAIRDELAELGTGEDSPFARVPKTHLARWVVVDDVPNHGVPAREDHTASKYLLFTSNFDGELDPYLDGMIEAIPDVVHRLYQYCIGYPGVEDRAAFRAYIRRCQIETTLLFGGYPGATLAEILRALDLKSRYVAFLAAHQCDTGADLRRAFLDFDDEFTRSPGLPPGSDGGPA